MYPPGRPKRQPSRARATKPPTSSQAAIAPAKKSKKSIAGLARAMAVW
jgi:hypothetical protein